MDIITNLIKRCDIFNRAAAYRNFKKKSHNTHTQKTLHLAR